MAERTVRAGTLWVRRAKRRMRIKMSDMRRYRSFKKAVDEPVGPDAVSAQRLRRDYRNEFLTLDERNKLIKSHHTPADLRHFTKLEIKERLFTAGVPVPLTYLTIINPYDIKQNCEFLMKNFRNGFVIKPNDGHSGRGILVVSKVIGGRFITARDEAWDVRRLIIHIERIIGGRFSRGRKDIAIVEERITQHYRMRNLAEFGLVDFRIIVSNGYPVMAMARLPTKRSRGKGNLHRGALGMGVALHSGVLTSGVYMDKPANIHPDTGVQVTGMLIPNWQEIIQTGARAQFFSGMKYAGVDIVVDKNGNVKVLEVNRRPGLSIQLANKAGLKNRLEFINGLNGSTSTRDNGHGSLKARVEFSMDMDKNGWDNNGEQN